MAQIITRYLVVVLLVSLGFFGVGALATAQELRDPMQPPPFAVQKFREAKWAANPKPSGAVVAKPKAESLLLTSIIFSDERKIAIIDDQMLGIGDRIKGAELVGLTRSSARLKRKDKVINLNLGTELTTFKKKTVKSDL
ncbi:MAG: hypothetical protein GY875_12280 [Gammaproteobacteria bacterium]|nr:hypothetical protein [Gammaproteobacteria bacterium]